MKGIKRFFILISAVCAVAVAFRVAVDYFADKAFKLKRLKMRFYNSCAGGYFIDSGDGPVAILLSNKINPYLSFFITALLGVASVVFSIFAFLIHIFSKN